jgi:hypothetical protein
LLGDLVKVRIPEGGVLRLQEVGDGTHFSHNVYMDSPDSWWGRLRLWFFEKQLNGRQALHDHADRELVFFKEKPEGKGLMGCDDGYRTRRASTVAGGDEV